MLFCFRARRSMLGTPGKSTSEPYHVGRAEQTSRRPHRLRQAGIAWPMDHVGCPRFAYLPNMDSRKQDDTKVARGAFMGATGSRGSTPSMTRGSHVGRQGCHRHPRSPRGPQVSTPRAHTHAHTDTPRHAHRHQASNFGCSLIPRGPRVC